MYVSRINLTQKKIGKVKIIFFPLWVEWNLIQNLRNIISPLWNIGVKLSMSFSIFCLHVSVCVCVCVCLYVWMFVCQSVHLSASTLFFLYSIFNNGCSKCDGHNGYGRMYISTRTIFVSTHHLNLIHLYQKGYTSTPVPFLPSFLSSFLLSASLFSTPW